MKWRNHLQFLEAKSTKKSKKASSLRVTGVVAYIIPGALPSLTGRSAFTVSLTLIGNTFDNHTYQTYRTKGHAYMISPFCIQTSSLFLGLLKKATQCWVWKETE